MIGGLGKKSGDLVFRLYLLDTEFSCGEGEDFRG